MKTIKYILMTLILLFLTGCTQNYSNSDNYNKYEEMISVNDYFKSNISNYKIELINYETQCLNGTCQPVNLDNKSIEKNCYFCNSKLITKDKKFLKLQSSKDNSGSMDAFFGCIKKYSGEEKQGFQIVNINDYQIKAKGKISTFYSQTSTICDKTKDPECDDTTYGKCPNPDYSQKLTKEVYLIIEK